MARKSRKNLPQPEQAAASVLLPELEEAKMPAAIYGRLSVEDEEKEESMETQIVLVQDYINRSSELSYVDTYFDNGFTGTNFKRPAFTRLMNDVRQKKIKCILLFLIFSTITIEKSQMHSSEFGGYTSSSRVF